MREPRLRTLVSRASAARPGTQGDASGSRFAILALGPRKSGLPDLRAFTRRSRAGPRSVSRSARASALAAPARDTRPPHMHHEVTRARAVTGASGHQFWRNEPTLQICNAWLVE